MKTTILLGLLLTLTASCKHHSNPVTTEENFHTQEANRLVAEAGKPMVSFFGQHFLL